MHHHKGSRVNLALCNVIKCQCYRGNSVNDSTYLKVTIKLLRFPKDRDTSLSRKLHRQRISFLSANLAVTNHILMVIG